MTVKYSTVENPSASCGRVFAILCTSLLLFAVGCREKGFDPSKVVCSIYVGDKCVGSGVFLGRVSADGQTNVVLLTARHVVTYNRNYGEILDVVTSTGSSRVRLRSPESRWLVSRDRSVDCAWLVLEEGEWGRIDNLEWVDLDETLANQSMPKRDDAIIVANPQKMVSGRYQMACKMTIMLPDNKVLKKINMPVGYTSAVTLPADSGSGVFSTLDGENALRFLGTATASRLDSGYTAYSAVGNIIDDILMSVAGDYGFRLISFPNMW